MDRVRLIWCPCKYKNSTITETGPLIRHLYLLLLLQLIFLSYSHWCVVRRCDPALPAQWSLPLLQGQRWPHCSHSNHDHPRLQGNHQGCQVIRCVTLPRAQLDKSARINPFLILLQVKLWCAAVSCLSRTSGHCVRCWEGGERHQRSKSHQLLKLVKTLVPKSMTHQHVLTVKGRLSGTEMKPVHWWGKRRAAGTGFLMRPMTCWTGFWTWIQPPGSQLLRPCTTPSSQTCKTLIIALV